MLDLRNRKCPFFEELCSTVKCTMWEERLENCIIRLLPYNLYKLDRSITMLFPTDSQPWASKPPKD